MPVDLNRKLPDTMLTVREALAIATSEDTIAAAVAVIDAADAARREADRLWRTSPATILGVELVVGERYNVTTHIADSARPHQRNKRTHRNCVYAGRTRELGPQIVQYLFDSGSTRSRAKRLTLRPATQPDRPQRNDIVGLVAIGKQTTTATAATATGEVEP